MLNRLLRRFSLIFKRKSLRKKFFVRFALFAFAFVFLVSTAAYFVFRSVKSSLPPMVTVKDYQPLLVSPVYDRTGKRIGEFFRERRTLVPYEKIPKHVVNAFLAAEDDQFFQHSGINYVAILRAAIANIRAGHTVQGASTITQQVAKTLLLKDPEKTLLRKVREALLAQQMEENLTKEEILYLYLNQIFFGQSAYGIELAAQTYFRKSVDKLTVPEAALLAGLPKAPSAYSPVKNPHRAKERQVYVLHRMAEVGYLTREEAEKATQEPVKVYMRETYEDLAPFYLETVRQLLVQKLGEDVVLDQGIRVYTGLDLKSQLAAQESVIQGLKQVDKRQGFRGALRTLKDEKEIERFLQDAKRKLIAESTPERTIQADGNFAEILSEKELKKNSTREVGKKEGNLPGFLKINQTVEALVLRVDDSLGLVYLRLPDADGLIDFETMRWARRPDTNKRFDLDLIKKPSDALKTGDVVHVRISAEKTNIPRLLQTNKKNQPSATPLPDFTKYLNLELDQEPLVEGSLISFDQASQDVLALVGGYSFARNEFNRALQAARQTGSSFKSIVYASALDKGYTPSTPIMDAPIVYEETKEDVEGQEDTKVWKPTNHGKTFGGEIIFRNALVKSLNIPTVKIIEDIGVPWPTEYARRLGIFSPLNNDFTLALGSSSVTLYEMTKVFSQLGRLGKRIRPLLIHRVEDRFGRVLIENVSLDLRFEKEMSPFEEDFEKRQLAAQEARQAAAAAATDTESTAPTTASDVNKHKPDDFFFFENQDQLIKPQTAYVMTTLLKGVIEDAHGTGGRARAIGREVAGKTGTTNGYFDAWFIGYTAQIATGVWVGFDKEHSLGVGEVGGRAALPIWVDYMKAAHETLPEMTFPVPPGIVFANIDSETGRLASASTKNILRQAFAEGTEPTASLNKTEEATDFYKQDLSE